MKLNNYIKLFAAAIYLFTLVSCTGYGTKVTFEGNKGEVYYKGEGVTETDAKALGKFLEDAQFFLKDDKTRSVQITKDSGRIKVRFVVDEKALASMPDADQNFAIIGAAMSKSVFNNVPVDVIYTDDYFKDIKTIPYKTDAIPAVNISEEVKEMDKKKSYNNILYYAKDISSEKADTILDFLVKSEFFAADGNIDLLLSKKGGGFHLKFPIKDSFNNDEGLQKVDNFGKEMKKSLFPDVPFEIEVLKEDMATVKNISY